MAESSLLDRCMEYVYAYVPPTWNSEHVRQLVGSTIEYVVSGETGVYSPTANYGGFELDALRETSYFIEDCPDLSIEAPEVKKRFYELIEQTAEEM